MRIRKRRTRYFVGAEGESEQSFVRWVQTLCEKDELHVYLDCKNLGGGGYKSLLKNADSLRKRGLAKGAYRSSYLWVDSDRTETGDLTLQQLQDNATQININLCCQSPNIESLLYKLHTGKETATPNAANVNQLLATVWPEYRKPMDARALERRFSKDDLIRVAQHDEGLANFLRQIGLMR